MRWEQLSVAGMGEAVIDQDDHAPVCLGADNPPRGLQDPIEAGVLVGIGKAATVLLIKILLDQVPFQPDLRHTHPNNHNPDQPFSHQVNALAKDSTHHRQTSHRSRTAKGESMLFLTLEDLSGMLKVVFFPNAYRQAKEIVSSSQPFLVTGTIEMDMSKGEPLLRVERTANL
jgi:hypothetical protein